MSANSLSSSKQAIHNCLKRLKAAKDGSKIRRLTDELQRIVFRKQYRDALSGHLIGGLRPVLAAPQVPDFGVSGSL
jgi:hypothetical protein